MKKIIALIFLVFFTINSCKPKKEYESIAKYIYCFHENVSIININQIDTKKQLDSFEIKNKLNTVYGVYFDLDKFEITNDTGNYKCIIPLFDYVECNLIACKTSSSLKLTLNLTNFTVNDSIYHYNNLKKFDTFIDLYVRKISKYNDIAFTFDSRWNRIIINDSISFKKQLFPVLNSMYKSYLKVCLDTTSNLYFSRDSKGNIKDFYTEIHGYDYDLPPLNPKSKFKFKTPKSIN